MTQLAHRLGRVAWRVLRASLLALAALWFFIEEFGWHPLATWLGSFTRWPPWARLEASIARLPPRPALWLFLLPATALLPVKLLAVSLIQSGRPVVGAIVIVLAKLFGTAIGGRLFTLMRPQLMTLRRFARAMAWWRRIRRLVRVRVRRMLDASAAWRAMRSGVARARARMAALFR